MPHIHRLIDFVNAMYVVHQGTQRVLMVRHKKLQKWLPPGGHIELDEDTDQALRRELKEETGLVEGEDCMVVQPNGWGTRYSEWAAMDPRKNNNVKHLWTPWRMNIHDFAGVEGHRHVCLIYLLQAWEDKVRLEVEGADAIRWMKTTELEDEVELDEVRLNAIDAIRLSSS